jgi:transcriptional regulator with XRE-family HTH domain
VNIFKAIRKERGMTQQQLADVLEITVGMVSHIERGRRKITPEHANEWASKLGVKREQLRPDVFGIAA